MTRVLLTYTHDRNMDMAGSSSPLGLAYLVSYLRKYCLDVEVKICTDNYLNVPIIVGGVHITTMPRSLSRELK